MVDFSIIPDAKKDFTYKLGPQKSKCFRSQKIQVIDDDTLLCN